MPAAVSSLTPSGIGTALLALIVTFCRQPLPPMEATTLCPGARLETPAPTASMVPATSPPGEWGSVGVT